MKPGVAARLAAARAVDRVVRHGAFSNVVLRGGSGDLDARDRAFVQFLTYTVLRYLLRIDRAIAAASSRPLERIEAALLDVLRLAAAELLIAGTPAPVVVSTNVEVAKTAAGARTAGFANAVLRRIAAGEPEIPETAAGRALAQGVPAWMGQRLEAAFGTDAAMAFLQASNRDASIGVRVRHGAERLGGREIPWIPGARYVEHREGIAAAVAAGEVVVADPASTAVVHALGPRPGDRILDLAAAPGGKTAHLWDCMEGRGTLVAADRHPRRLVSARRRLAAYGISPAWVVTDALRPAFVPASFDRVLLDAPCTGLGTLRRRPEIRHRVEEDAPRRLGRAQRRMVDAALSLLRPGGTLVYSVCTVFPEETVDVVADLDAVPPDLPGRPWGRGVLLGPHLTGTDGMFISVVRRSPATR